MSVANLVLGVLCLFLASTGMLFLLIQWRSHYDRSLLAAGLCLILLSVFAGIDKWVLPIQQEALHALYWTRIQHILGLAIGVLLYWYLLILGDSGKVTALRILTFVSMILSVLMLSEYMLVLRNDDVATTMLYKLSFLPFMIAFMILIGKTLFLGIHHPTRSHRRIMWFHIVGFAVLVLCGFGDALILATIGQLKLPIAGLTVIGVFAFGTMVALVFTERFLMLIRERAEAYEKMHEAYRELEAAAGVRQLGEVAGMVGHETRNDLQVIYGALHVLLKRNLVHPDGVQSAERIVRRIRKSIQFNIEILDVVRSRVLKAKVPLDLCGLIDDCIERGFAGWRDAFTWESPRKELIVHGDWGKLENVFHNLLKNAFEAGANRIRFRYTEGPGVLVFTIDDNGEGCDSVEKTAKLFTAFHSTKDVFGTGLGMSLSRAIVESHGGAISAYSKNLLPGDKTGLCVELMFPVFEDGVQKSGAEYGSVVLVKDGLQELEAVLRVLKNLHITPQTVGRISELRRDLLEVLPSVVLVDSSLGEDLQRVDARYRRSLTLLSHTLAGTFALRSEADTAPALFTEEYLLRCLRDKDAPARPEFDATSR